MRPFSDALLAALEGPVTTLPHGWRLTRHDGLVLGFTDHDEALTFAGTRFAARTGLSASEAESETGLAATTGEVAGALSSEAVTEADILAGRYDGARVETFLVDWTEPEVAHGLIGVHHIGEVKRSDIAFTAELRSRTTELDRVRGRLYRRRCDAVFGDGRCGVDLAASGFRVEASVVSGEEASVTLAGDFASDPRRYVFGSFDVLSGSLEGLTREIVSADKRLDGTLRLGLDEPLPEALSADDRVRIGEGCDKRFSTCRDRFANGLNFRGFPHMPGTDAALKVAKSDEAHDGRPLVP
ncbi:MAG: DUF2163 domain-containing protein [Fulvimarina manganoxydans]|uniref:DUF2163 domain-containing protein n=1 Tax=Fulvimarina manganoxydans TaxID=937218 RepID=UPI002356F56C|nr:DUF2163 domain-containing protein [Fulvimarina manganoxydans]MCK5933433.1 DUF2163 domain-containing protein [Fulvimarina manganoxydans]